MGRAYWAVNGIDEQNLAENIIEGRRFMADNLSAFWQAPVMETGEKPYIRETREEDSIRSMGATSVM